MVCALVFPGQSLAGRSHRPCCGAGRNHRSATCLHRSCHRGIATSPRANVTLGSRPTRTATITNLDPTSPTQRTARTPPARRCPMSAPTTPVAPIVDDAGLESLVAEVAREEAYAFDTEFHTERTYVPELALIQIAWADKVALVDPLAVDPAPLAEVFGGPGVAVAHAATQDLDVLMAACGVVPATVFDTQIVAGFIGMSTPSLSRLVDVMLGVPLPKADRLSDWLERPMSDRQLAYAVSDVAHLLELRAVLTDRLRALGRLEWALSECDQVLTDRTPPARVPEEAWWRLGDIRSMSRRSRAVAQEVAAWRERTAAESNRPRRQVLSDLGLLADLAAAAAQRGRAPTRPGRRRPPPGPGAGRRDPGGGPPRPRPPLRPPPHAVGGAGGAGPGRRRRRVLGSRAPDRRRPRLRSDPAGHPRRHLPAALQRAEPPGLGLAAHHRRGPAATPHRGRGGGRLRPPGATWCSRSARTARCPAPATAPDAGRKTSRPPDRAISRGDGASDVSVYGTEVGRCSRLYSRLCYGSGQFPQPRSCEPPLL